MDRWKGKKKIGGKELHSGRNIRINFKTNIRIKYDNFFQPKIDRKEIKQLMINKISNMFSMLFHPWFLGEANGG